MPLKKNDIVQFKNPGGGHWASLYYKRNDKHFYKIEFVFRRGNYWVPKIPKRVWALLRNLSTERTIEVPVVCLRKVTPLEIEAFTKQGIELKILELQAKQPFYQTHGYRLPAWKRMEKKILELHENRNAGRT